MGVRGAYRGPKPDEVGRASASLGLLDRRLLVGAGEGHQTGAQSSAVPLRPVPRARAGYPKIAAAVGGTPAVAFITVDRHTSR